MGQLPEGAVILVETVEDVASLEVENADNLAYCTQTTLSVDDTADIVNALQLKFPAMIGPHKEDICYATTNRQAAVKEIAEECDAMIVIGAPNSSNSNRLVEVGSSYGADKSMLVQRASDIDWAWLEGVKILGLSAGASAPDVLVDEVIEAISKKYNVKVETKSLIEENVVFNIPRVLRDAEEKRA